MITSEGHMRWRVFEGGREQIVIGARHRAEQVEKDLGKLRALDVDGARFRRIERIAKALAS